MTSRLLIKARISAFTGIWALMFCRGCKHAKTRLFRLPLRWEVATIWQLRTDWFFTSNSTEYYYKLGYTWHDKRPLPIATLSTKRKTPTTPMATNSRLMHISISLVYELLFAEIPGIWSWSQRLKQPHLWLFDLRCYNTRVSQLNETELNTGTLRIAKQGFSQWFPL